MNQRGFAFLPFLLANWQMIAIAGLALVVGGYYLHCEHVKKDHATFVAKLEAQAEEQLRQNKLKEAANAKQIKDALSERDLALKRLHNRPNPVSLSGIAAAPAGSREVSLDATAYNTALGRYRERLNRGLDGIARLAPEGDEAAIDAETLLKAWPK